MLYPIIFCQGYPLGEMFMINLLFKFLLCITQKGIYKYKYIEKVRPCVISKASPFNIYSIAFSMTCVFFPT